MLVAIAGFEGKFAQKCKDCSVEQGSIIYDCSSVSELLACSCIRDVIELSIASVQRFPSLCLYSMHIYERTN
jgi:hypothetical protein